MNSSSPLETDPLVQQFNRIAATVRQGGTLGPLLSITPEECDALYTLGRNLYQQGHYAEAFKAFSLLVMFDHLNDDYFMALAAAAQLLGRHEDALHNYATVTLMRLDDPAPVFHSAECLVALGRLDEAIESLELVLTLEGHEAESANVPDDPASYAGRALALLPLLRQRAREGASHKRSS